MSQKSKKKIVKTKDFTCIVHMKGYSPEAEKKMDELLQSLKKDHEEKEQ